MKRSESLETKSLVDSLLADGPAPTSVASGEFERARALARSIPNANPPDVESLPEPLAVAVLDASVRARDPRLAEALSSSARKPLAKAAKKSLYQLRSLGLPIPERSEPPAAPPIAAPVEELPSLLSSVSGEGEQALLIPRTLRGGGVELLQIIISDEKGITEVIASDVGRSAYRKQLREIRAGRAAPAVEIPREEAKRILSAAAALNVPSGNPYPAGAEEALRHLSLAPQSEEWAIPPPVAEDERLAIQGSQLHTEPEMQPWLPPEPQIRVLAARMDQVTHSPLELSEAQRSQQILNLFHTAAREFFTPAMLKLYAGRLWRMASYFEGTKRDRQAQIARAEARRMFHGAVEPFSRFGEFLFEKVLWLSQRGRAGEAPQGAAESTPAAETPTEHRSPGGLILP
ncbi:MAG TPA: hypothetical protein VEM39_01420 [Myxococcaceae bacterium]|nr:hypothetical protein [Myxococcaceae bacterium]